jgi:hypothetical protein
MGEREHRTWDDLSLIEKRAIERLADGYSVSPLREFSAATMRGLVDAGLVYWDGAMRGFPILTERGWIVIKRSRGILAPYKAWRCQTCGQNVGRIGRALQAIVGCALVSECLRNRPMVSVRRLLAGRDHDSDHA